MKTMTMAILFFVLSVFSAYAQTPIHDEVCIPWTTNLFGPVQYEGALKIYTDGAWKWPGNAMSASTKLFWAGYGFPEVRNARVVVVWTPYSTENRIKIVSFDSGPSDIKDLAVIDGDNRTTPRVSAALIGDALQDIVENQETKQIGFMVSGTNTGFVIYEVRIEAVFCF